MICESTTVVEIVADLTSMSKNLKTVAICLEEIANLMERGISEGVSEKTFKQLFKYVENPDQSLKKATILLIEQTYQKKHLSEDQIMKLLGKVNQNIKLSLKEKFTKIDNQPKKGHNSEK